MFKMIMHLLSIGIKFYSTKLYFYVLPAHIREHWGSCYDPHIYHFSAQFAGFLKGGNMMK